jgi:hypothetical protein
MVTRRAPYNGPTLSNGAGPRTRAACAVALVRIALVLVAGRDGKTGASPASYDYEDIHITYFMEPVSVRRNVPRPESVGSALVS